MEVGARFSKLAAVVAALLGALLLLVPQPAQADEQYTTDIHSPIVIEYAAVAGFGSIPNPTFASNNEAVAIVTPAGSSVMSFGSNYWIAASCKVTPTGPGSTTISYYLGSSLISTTTVTITGSHTVVHSDAVEATCELPGMSEGTYCTECGLTLNGRVETSPALGHAWGEWVVTKNATATVSGTRERTCSTCGKRETESFGGVITGDSDAAQQLINAQDSAAVRYVNSVTSKTISLKKGAKKTAAASSVSLPSKTSSSGNIVVYKKKGGSAKISVTSKGKATLKKGTAKGVYTAKVLASCGKVSKTVKVKFTVR